MRKIALIVLASFFFDFASSQVEYAVQRNRMVKTQLLDRGITDVTTIKAMRKVQRHLFVPHHLRKYAYSDQPLPIGNGQTISQPYIVAYMTQDLRLKPKHRVLEIGTGSGYQAAVLAAIVDSVYTIEIVEPLAIIAKKRLQHLGYKNVITKVGDGYHGWHSKSPFDAIMVTAAVKEIPQALLSQLAEGGRMIIPVGLTPYNRNLILVTKKKGKIRTKKRIPVAFVPFTRDKE